MVAAVLSRLRRRSLVVVLTDLNATALDEGLIPVLPQLASRHLVLLAAVADPRVAALAAGREGPGEVFDAAAAERQGVERRQVTARLRRHGVEVVDALPDDLASALADAYLSPGGRRAALGRRHVVGRVGDVARLADLGGSCVRSGRRTAGRGSPAVAPMAMRAQVGSGDGVTRPSIRPEISSTTASPSTTATTARAPARPAPARGGAGPARSATSRPACPLPQPGTPR